MKVFNVRKDDTPSNILYIFDVYHPKGRFTIRGCKLVNGAKGEFIAMPSRYDMVEDKKEYYNIFEWDKEVMGAWASQIKPLLKEAIECV